MIINILQALFMTAFIFLMDSISVTIRKWFWYPLIFLLFALGNLFVLPRLQADIYSHHYSVTTKDEAYLREQINFHKEECIRTFNDAKDACWYLPNTSDRSKAKRCFQAAMGTIMSASPTAKVISAIVFGLTEYGLDCIDEWNYIQNKLHWAEYHAEMAEFYSKLLVTEQADTKSKPINIVEWHQKQAKNRQKKLKS